MYLKSLEISGFKSFAKKVDLEFNTNVSAIVGPNGSGKSNVAEAFRFVLGEQSMKSMRGKRGEDLIFNGSQTVPRGNRASVKIVFDNKSKFLNVDFDEVIIERTVHRDGTNAYSINKSPVRLKDISELLSGANIGSSGHHMISQGEADRILNVNPKERKMMIEEALGLKIYQYKRIASEKKLEKVQKNIEEVQSLRKENAPHLRFLNRQIKKIEKTIEMRKELGVLYQEYFKREKTYLDYWKTKITQDKQPLLIKLEELKQKESEAREILEKSKSLGGLTTKSEELVGLEDELRELRNQKDDLSRILGRVEGMVSALENKPLVSDSDDKPEIKVSLVSIQKLQSEINSQIELAENLEDVFQVKGVLKRVQESLSQFVIRYSDDKNIPEEPKDNSDEQNKQIEKLKKDKLEAENKIKEISLKEDEISQKLKSLQEEIEKNKDSNQGAELAVLEISAQTTTLNSELNSLIHKENRIIADDENYKREMNESYVLAGRDAVQFKDSELNPSEIIDEDRGLQIERLKKIERIKILVEEMGGGSSEDVIKEHEEATKRDQFLTGEIEDLEKSAESLVFLIDDLKEKIESEFKNGLEKINGQFKDFFVLMFGGGRAGLNLVQQKNNRKSKNELNMSDEDLVDEVENGEDEKDEKGVEVDVVLPNKKVKGLQMLSGGERSLTSIALLFAMSQVTPPPFIILDETDAALDEANSRKYGDMIEKLSSHSQLILITHNRETMSRANILYGVTMTADGISKLLSVKFAEAVKDAK